MNITEIVSPVEKKPNRGITLVHICFCKIMIKLLRLFLILIKKLYIEIGLEDDIDITRLGFSSQNTSKICTRLVPGYIS